MKIFLTGATGFIGSALIVELLGAGHQVVGLTRSQPGAEALLRVGVEPFYGHLEEPESLKEGVVGVDGVIHCAFDHNFTNYQANCQKDRRVLAALGDALVGSDRPLVITSATGLGSTRPGGLSCEDEFDPNSPIPRVATELEAEVQLERGVNLSVVRLPQVHDTVKQGLITPYIEMCRQIGACYYVAEGSQRWAACHISDAVGVFRGALENARAGARYHAVGEEGVSLREIAEAIGQGLGIPVDSVSADQAAGELGWLSGFLALDMAASSRLTRERLNWSPRGPSLLQDLADWGRCRDLLASSNKGPAVKQGP